MSSKCSPDCEGKFCEYQWFCIEWSKEYHGNGDYKNFTKNQVDKDRREDCGRKCRTCTGEKYEPTIYVWKDGDTICKECGFQYKKDCPHYKRMRYYDQ